MSQHESDQAEYDAINEQWLGTVYAFRRMPDGMIAGVSPQLFTFGLFTHLSADRWRSPYRHRWCYEVFQDAVLALRVWDGRGEPAGPWLKYKPSRGTERYNALLYEFMDGDRYRRRLPEEIDMGQIWPTSARGSA